jgi:KaiC/GvpD/RAD55 family RecA-like ATPase
MAKYDFSTLNSTDLEELVCDLMNAKQPNGSGINYRTFKEGKDQGIDFLHSTEAKEFSHVGQVKHFYRTGLTKLLSLLKKDEIKKVNNLRPDKFIFATSVDLSPTNAKEIKAIFKPFIKNLSDIYGKGDLNRLIEQYDDVLERHYKLWFSDTSVLKLLLKSDLQFKSSVFEEYELQRRLRLFVKTASFEVARSLLKKFRFIIITGEPGVGKTTMAETLAYEYIRKGFKLTYIEDIVEADRALKNDKSKQLIYFDDFLGSNSIEINKAMGSETQLRRVLTSVSKLKNKMLIMTTRTFLLNAAIEESENLERFNIKANESTILIEEYTTELKEQLIRNHIEDSEITKGKKQILRSKELITFMATHKFFNPRIVEFITTTRIVQAVDDDNYAVFVKQNFNSPDIIWKHAYYKQIKPDDQWLLNTLLSFKNLVTTKLLRNAFDKRLELEMAAGIRVDVQAFNKCMKRLLGGFITERKRGALEFINPSLKDFLLKEVMTDAIEMNKISNSIISIDQFKVISDNFLSRREKLPLLLKNRIITKYAEFIGSADEDELIYFASILPKHFELSEVEEIICEILEEVRDWESITYDYETKRIFESFLIQAQNSPRIYSIIEEGIVPIITSAVIHEYDPEKAIDSIHALTVTYSVDLSEFDTTELSAHITDIIEQKIDEEIEFLKDNATDQGEATDMAKEINYLIDRARELGLSIKTSTSAFGKVEWWDVAMHNELRRLMDKDD